MSIGIITASGLVTLTAMCLPASASHWGLPVEDHATSEDGYVPARRALLDPTPARRPS